MQCMSVQAAAVETPSKELILPKYCEDIYRTQRRKTRTVKVRTSCIIALSASLRLCLQFCWTLPLPIRRMFNISTAP